MTTVRDVLNLLGGDTLRRLVDLRGLDRARSLVEMRTRLARSYRGDMAQFIDDLLRKELVAIFEARYFHVDGRRVFLSNPARYDKAQLHAMAKTLFIKGRAPREFDVENPEKESLRPLVGGGDEDDHEESGYQSELANAFKDVGEEWGRPWKMSRVLTKAGLDVPERLRQTRFHELLKVLEELGIEARLADGEEPLTFSDSSPGIHAKLRLRRRKRGARGKAGSTVPPRPRPIEIVPGGPIPKAIPRLDPWAMALARLKLLTALPSLSRERESGWPSAFVAASVEGIGLPDEKVRLLGTIAAQFVRGEHDPFEVLNQLLEGGIDTHEWERLFGMLAVLNPGRVEIEHYRDYVSKRGVRISSATPAEALSTAVAGIPVEHANKGEMLFMPSDCLAKVVGSGPVSANDVRSRVLEYIEERSLQDPNDKQFIHGDSVLVEVFGGRRRVTMSDLPGLLASNLSRAAAHTPPTLPPAVRDTFRGPGVTRLTDPSESMEPEEVNARSLGGLDDMFD